MNLIKAVLAVVCYVRGTSWEGVIVSTELVIEFAYHQPQAGQS
jgi:hypothetical protein